MQEEKKVMRMVAYYHLSFADAEWNDLPALSRQFLTAHELMAHVENWNQAHQRAVRLGISGVTTLSGAAFMSLEVHYGEA